jgi:hypothetical protein
VFAFYLISLAFELLGESSILRSIELIKGSKAHRRPFIRYAAVIASCSPDARTDSGPWEGLRCGICRCKTPCRVLRRMNSWDVRIFSAFATSSHSSDLRLSGRGFIPSRID